MSYPKKTLIAGVIVLIGAIGFCGLATNQMKKVNAIETNKQTSTTLPKGITSGSQNKEEVVYTIDQLSSAVLSNEKDKVKQILDSKQVDINSKDAEGQYPLENVLVFDNVEMAALLLENGANPHLEREVGMTVAKAVEKNNNQAMKALFKNY